MGQEDVKRYEGVSIDRDRRLDSSVQLCQRLRMANMVNVVESNLIRNMLVAARAHIAGARTLHEVTDPGNPDPETLYTVILLSGLAVELAFKAVIVKFGATAATARYSIGPGLRRAEDLAREWGYVGPAPGTARLLGQIADAYLNVATRRYDMSIDLMAFDVDEILAWTEDLIADVESRKMRAHGKPLPNFLVKTL